MAKKAKKKIECRREHLETIYIYIEMEYFEWNWYCCSPNRLYSITLLYGELHIHTTPHSSISFGFVLPLLLLLELEETPFVKLKYFHLKFGP